MVPKIPIRETFLFTPCPVGGESWQHYGTGNPSTSPVSKREVGAWAVFAAGECVGPADRDFLCPFFPRGGSGKGSGLSMVRKR